MRIVIDMQGAQTGSRLRGIGRYTESIARALARNRGEHEVLLALNGLFPETVETLSEAFRELLPPDNIRVFHAIGPTRASDPANAWRRSASERIRETFLESLQPDVVLVTGHFEGFESDAVASTGILSDAFPVATILYDLIPLLRPALYPVQSPYGQWYQARIESLKRSAMLLAISESARREALVGLDWDPNRVVAVMGACEDSFGANRPTDAQLQALKARLRIDRPFVMYAGGADPTKNLPRLIAGYAELPRDLRARHQLVLVGDMPDSSVQELRRCAASVGLAAEDLVFTGYVQDAELIGLYSSCALFVFPSLHEGFGLPPLEAMTCGAVVIGADATSLQEVIGLPEARFDPESTAAIARKIELGLADEEFRGRLRSHARENIGRFSWDDTARRVLTALHSCVEQHRARISPQLNLVCTGAYRRRTLRILIIKLDHIGDFILSIPAISKLRARYPYAAIDAVVGSWNVAAARSLGLFREVLGYDLFTQKSADLPSVKEEALHSLLRQLPHYDIAIDLRRQPDSRFLLHRIHADLKVGYHTYDAEADRGMQIALPVYPDRAAVTTPLNTTSQAEQMVALVDALPANVNDFIKFPALGEYGRREPGTVAVFPKAGLPTREWSVENFRELVALLLENEHIQTVHIYFAHANEAEEFGLAQRENLQVHVGLSFPELTKSLSASVVCIANNSGGAHLAAYLGLTVIAIFSGHELPAEWAPPYHESYALYRGAECSPCHIARSLECPYGLYCLHDIAVFDVYAKVMEALAAPGGNSRGASTSGHAGLAEQLNEDALVKRLLASVAALGPPAEESEIGGVARAVGRNHPNYKIDPDLTGIHPNQEIGHRSSRVQWKGFFEAEQELRWTDGTAAAIEFDLHVAEPIAGRPKIELLIRTRGRQRILARLNGSGVCDAAYQGENITLMIPGQHLKAGSNVLEFDLPDARVPGRGDTRRIAIAVMRLVVRMQNAPANQGPRR
jgi:glycosyltransferase involved in cell wall biosynthesis